MKHFDQDSVRIERTELSNQDLGIVHLAICLESVVSLFVANRIRLYLEHELDGTISCVFDPHAKRVYLFCFVITPIGCDAKQKLTGLLGLQAERYLATQ